MSTETEITEEIEIPAEDKPTPLDEKQFIIVNNIQSTPDSSEVFKNITLFGEINEASASEIINSFLFLENLTKNSLAEDSEENQETGEIGFYISTHGGSVSEMFSIIDIMQKIKESTCDISTYALGKVMSAGVPILAAGTKGKRRIGKNCRLMLHSVTAGYTGNITSLENELKEIKWNQKRYIECLSDYSNLSREKIKKMLKSQKEIYISAEKAIKYGIADEII